MSGKRDEHSRQNGDIWKRGRSRGCMSCNGRVRLAETSSLISQSSQQDFMTPKKHSMLSLKGCPKKTPFPARGRLSDRSRAGFAARTRNMANRNTTPDAVGGRQETRYPTVSKADNPFSAARNAPANHAWPQHAAMESVASHRGIRDIIFLPHAALLPTSCNDRAHRAHAREAWR